MFASDREGNFDIYTIAPDGLAVQLTTDTAEDRDPVWSPDGNHIAFISDREDPGSGFFNLYVMDAGGTKIVKVADRTAHMYSLAEPAWSPNGDMIAFTGRYSPGGFYSGYSYLYRVDIDVNNLAATPPAQTVDDDSNPIVTTNENSSPTWSPDSLTIAFVGNGDVYRIDVDGASSSYDKILTSTAAESELAWSPDGLSIAFVRPDGVYVMDADGSNERFVVASGLGDGNPAWSSDGNSLACSGTSSGESRIYTLDLSQNTATPVEPMIQPRADVEPDW